MSLLSEIRSTHQAAAPAPPVCSSCSSAQFWRSVYSTDLHCAACTPPADDSLVASWHPPRPELTPLPQIPHQYPEQPWDVSCPACDSLDVKQWGSRIECYSCGNGQVSRMQICGAGQPAKQCQKPPAEICGAPYWEEQET